VSWVWLSLALGAEPVTEESTYNRLFKETSEQPVPEPVSQPEGVSGSWIIPLSLLALAGGILLWQRLQKADALKTTGSLTVLQRQAIGDRTSLVLVEVTEPEGDKRRLLLGTGPGAPVLIADLGYAESAPPVFEQAPEVRPSTRPPSPPRPSESVRTRPERPEENIAREILAERGRSRFHKEDSKDEPFREEDDYDPDPDNPPKSSRLLARIGD
jgi:flagellar biogenesis protein FliO